MGEVFWQYPCIEDLCTKSLEEIAWQDRCKRSLYKIPVQVLYKRPLGEIAVRDLYTRSLYKFSIRGLLARSLYDISMQDLCERSALKISARDLYRRSLVTISVRGFHTRYLKRSPGKISAQGLCEIDFLARSSIKDLRTRFLYRRSLHKILKRSRGKIAVQVLLDRISPQREWSDTHEVTRGLHEHMLESARATKSKHVIYDVLTRFLALFRRGPWRTCHEERAWAIWSTAPATKTDHHVANQKWRQFHKTRLSSLSRHRPIHQLGQHFVADVLRKRKIEEPVCCKGHHIRRTRRRETTLNQHQDNPEHDVWGKVRSY